MNAEDSSAYLPAHRTALREASGLPQNPAGGVVSHIPTFRPGVATPPPLARGRDLSGTWSCVPTATHPARRNARPAGPLDHELERAAFANLVRRSKPCRSSRAAPTTTWRRRPTTPAWRLPSVAAAARPEAGSRLREEAWRNRCSRFDLCGVRCQVRLNPPGRESVLTALKYHHIVSDKLVDERADPEEFGQFPQCLLTAD